MSQSKMSPSFSDYKTVGEAAAFLGVSAATLRNWDRSGKLKPRRHPQNGYRIYLHEELMAVLRSADRSCAANDAAAPLFDWSEIAQHEHFVQFYETDEYLVASVAGFVRAALSEKQSAVLIATAEHAEDIQSALTDGGTDVAAAVEQGRFVILDAAETLSKLMVDGAPDPRRFRELIGEMMTRLGREGRRIHAFGEMVALLWSDGEREAAIRLEELWNELRRSHPFALFCAYPLSGFERGSDAAPFDGVCKCHTRVIPAESYTGLRSRQERLRAITSLQQKAQSLEAEIAHRGQVEQDLSERERELADFFDNATEGFRKVGPDGTILWANKAEYTLLGYTADEYIGRPLADFHVDGEVAADMLARLRRGEALENFPARLRCKDVSIRHVLVDSSACIQEGQFVYSRCFTRDVTQQRQIEQALRDADRCKAEFLATLAHELRNPLAPIHTAVELLFLAGPRDDLSTESVRIIDRQSRQLARLVDDLLDVSRATREKLELRMRHVDLSALVATAVETRRPLVEAAGQTLTISLPPWPILVDADPSRLVQVFLNLLDNSTKFTNRGGRIEVEVRTEDADVLVSVRDNGIGIASENLAFVFDMFWRFTGTRDRVSGGLGIGLTLARRLVELHGGTIEAESEGPEKGSAFVIRLPLARAEDASMTAGPTGAAFLS
jgi:PAS domain S-box-containing protein